jgi:MtN3 and saliva related transmembrane protein
MSLETLLGAFAAFCSTASFAPQAIKIIRTRETKDISLWMYLLTVAGFAAWTSYGLVLGRWPLIAANSICLLLSGFILLMKLLPRGKKDKIADAVTPDA